MSYLVSNDFLRLICIVNTITLELPSEMNEKDPLRYNMDFMSG